MSLEYMPQDTSLERFCLLRHAWLKNHSYFEVNLVNNVKRGVLLSDSHCMEGAWREMCPLHASPPCAVKKQKLCRNRGCRYADSRRRMEIPTSKRFTYCCLRRAGLFSRVSEVWDAATTVSFLSRSCSRPWKRARRHFFYYKRESGLNERMNKAKDHSGNCAVASRNQSSPNQTQR